MLQTTGNDADPSSARWGSLMSDTIVLLHGSATGSSSWDAVAGSLVSAGARVFAPDLLGYGRSPAPSGSYGMCPAPETVTVVADSDYAPGGRRRRRSTRNGRTKPKPRSTHMSRILAVRASIEGLWT